MMAMVIRHGTKAGHQEVIQAVGDDVVHYVGIPCMQHSKSDVCQDECIQLIPLLRGCGKLGSRCVAALVKGYWEQMERCIHMKRP